MCAHGENERPNIYADCALSQTSINIVILPSSSSSSYIDNLNYIVIFTVLPVCLSSVVIPEAAFLSVQCLRD